MIRSVLTLRTTPAQVEEILRFYRREQILQVSFDNTRQINSDIAVATDGSGELLVTADWPDKAAYQEWVDHPRRAETAPELGALLADAEVGVGKVYLIDHGVTRS
ncbi:hypothetical protein [Galactobacter sp.]|uniref:hypothetical protein n=1 Tax=Galactobacter sp. TaxID=2676125 RepID=UPI0025C1E8C0|nr:hypothetical protein [Galactobacter sp.]